MKYLFNDKEYLWCVELNTYNGVIILPVNYLSIKLMLNIKESTFSCLILLRK